MSKKFLSLLALVCVSIVLAGCAQQVTENDEEEKINVMVSILPQVSFVEAIGGDQVAVNEMIPPGFSPATYEPSPDQLKKLHNADLYFRIGHIPFEKAQIERISTINRDMQIIDTSVGISLRHLEAHTHHDDEEGHEEGDEHEHEEEHGHEHEDEHAHAEEDEHGHAEEHAHEHEEEHEDEHEHDAGGDPHIWLAPQLVKIQAQHIYDALVAEAPEHEDYFAANYESFITELDALDQTLSETFAPVQGKTIFVFHPAFGYLADAYGFTQEAIEFQGKDPSPQHLESIIEQARAEDVQVIFVQKQFSTKSATAIASELGGAVVQIDPLAKDYFANLEALAETIVSNIQ